MTRNKKQSVTGQRQLKRTWLLYQRLILTSAPPQDEEATPPSALPRQAEALAALDAITDDVWVCAALLDALSTSPQESSGNEMGCIRSLTSRALKRTQSVARLSPETKSLSLDILRLLDVRRRAIRYARLLDVYQRVWSHPTSVAPSTAEYEEKQVDEDPWADARDATPTPDVELSNTLVDPVPPLREFLTSSVRAHAYNFAASFDVPKLRALLFALSRVELEELFKERLQFTHLLLYAGALQGVEMQGAVRAGLLPQADAQGNESDAWLAAMAESAADEEEELEDASVHPELAVQLESIFGTLDLASVALPPSLLDGSAQEATHPLTAAQLAEWYAKLITQLESSTGNAGFASQLAQLVQDASFHLPALSELQRTSQDLCLLNALIHSSQAQASQVHTLSSFRAALSTEAGRRQLALEHVKYADSMSAAEAATRSVLPCLEVIASRYGVQRVSTDEACVTLILNVLQLQGTALDPLLLAAAILRTASLEPELSARLVLTAIYGSTRTDGGARAAFGVLLDAAPASVPADAHTAEALAQLLAPKAEPLDVAKLFEALPSLGTPRSVLPLAQSHVRASKVFAARGGAARMSPASLAAAAADREAQRRLAVRLLRASESKGLDWNSLRREVEGMAASGGMLELLGAKEAGALVLKQVLQSGDLTSARKLLGDGQAESMSEAEVEKVVLETSRELYDNAQSANLHRGEMKAAYECLEVLPSTPALAAEKSFIEGTSKLCSYTTASRLRPGHSLSPLEIRLEADRVSLVARMLALNERAYRTPDLIIDIATKLSGVAVPATSEADVEETNALPPKALTEVRTWAAISAAALAAEDFTASQEACQRLVDKVSALRARAAAARSAGAPAAATTGSAASILEPAQAEAWQACLQLARHQGWDDLRGRSEIMSHVLALCPADRLGSLLPQWRTLEAQADARDASAPPGSLRAASRRSAARTATTSKESFVSPFSALFAQTGFSAGARRAAAAAGLSGSATAATVATKPKDSAPVGGFGRAAQLFDAFGEVAGGAGAAYYDPAERAARAARSFFGGLAGAGSERVRVLSGAPATRATSQERERTEDGAPAGGFSISRVGGWLMGEEDRR